ncbi:hypothetical protein C9994_06965 [Marivirga lumbricoides]|uniref:Uncharacterized protein n=1 Tax=Marivirga lumbricoides TaxID=1046115 RepID=A0A2T4DRU4_9BACT|nr:hypothetical protein C9994_06965 [Marivirga lumbricoides]
MNKYLIFLVFLFACSEESKTSKQYTFSHNQQLVEIRNKIQLIDKGAILNNFVVKEQLDGKILYLMGQQSNEVSAYDLKDSVHLSFEYKKQPVEISDFSFGDDQFYLMSGSSKTIYILDKKDGSFQKEINLNLKSYIIDYRLGESLFYFSESEKLFYVGLKEDINASGIEIVGAFDMSGQLQFTFGDFSKDNQKAKPGYLLSNDGIRSQLTKNALYILKKETSNLYKFNLKGSLIESEKLEFIKLPDYEKTKIEGRNIIKDQVMDFHIDENKQEIVYTYITNTGGYMGEKRPDTYLAFKKLKSDSITYANVDFIKLIDFNDGIVSTIPINKNSENKYYTKYKLNDN